MKVLVCSPGLSFQVDAPYSTLRRANAMVAAGLQVMVVGFPSEYPGSTEACSFKYVSVLEMQSERKRKRWNRWKSKLGNYSTFVLEPYLVKKYAYRIAGEQKFDVVYITHLEPWLMVPLLLRSWLRNQRVPTAGMIPTVFYVKAAMEGRPLSSVVRGGLNQVISRWLPRHMCVLANSKYVPIVMQLPKNQNVQVIPEGYENLMGTRSQSEARKSLNIPQNKRMVLLLGVASKAKGADLLFDALQQVPPEFLVYVVGQTGGVYERSWGPVERLMQSGWKDHLVVVSRFVSEVELADYYAACDAVVVPYRQGFATTSTHLRHASEFGKAIIASDQYLLGDIVREYQLGLLFPPEDVEALRRCLFEFSQKSQDWFDQIRRNSARLVAEQSWERVGQMYRELFERMTVRQ